MTIVNVVALFMGHNHTKLDQLLSRNWGALRGKDCFTVDGAAAASPGDTAVHRLVLEPLGSRTAMDGVDRGGLPGEGASDAQPCPGACLPACEGQGMQWKQWTTDESWSRPVQVLPNRFEYGTSVCWAADARLGRAAGGMACGAACRKRVVGLTPRVCVAARSDSAHCARGLGSRHACRRHTA